MNRQRGTVSAIDGMTCAIIVVLGGILLGNSWGGLSVTLRAIGVGALLLVAIFGIWLEASGQTKWPKTDD